MDNYLVGFTILVVDLMSSICENKICQYSISAGWNKRDTQRCDACKWWHWIFASKHIYADLFYVNSLVVLFFVFTKLFVVVWDKFILTFSLFIQFPERLLLRSRNIGPWKISERAYVNSNTTKTTYLYNSVIDACSFLNHVSVHID